MNPHITIHLLKVQLIIWLPTEFFRPVLALVYPLKERTTSIKLTADYGLRTTDYGLRTTDYGLRTGSKTWTEV